MAQYGMSVGIALVVLAIGCALALGAKAARSVEQFRAEEHETFARKETP